MQLEERVNSVAAGNASSNNEKQSESVASEGDGKSAPVKTYRERLTETQEKLSKFGQLLSREREVLNFRLNSNIETRNPLDEPAEVVEQHKKKLEEVCKFLKTVAVKRAIEEMKNETEKSYTMCDSKSFSKFLHSFGINIRYLGYLHDRISEQGLELNSNLLLFLERIILVRCLKHVFRKVMRSAAQTYLADAIAHLFNCIFAPQSKLTELESQPT